MKKNKKVYKKYNKFDVVYADFGHNPHGVESGVRPGIIISCDASNTLYFDYVSTTNECIDLPYIATICQDMYEKSMSLGIVTIPCTFLKVAKHGKLRQNKAF